MDQQLRALVDRAELSALFDRYVVTLDTADREDRNVAWYRTMFTDDIRMAFPIGEHHGVAGLPEFQRRAMLRWQATHHRSMNHTFDVDGDRARMRAQLVATHVEKDTPTASPGPQRQFHIGGHYRADAVRTPRGWRISDLLFVVVWSAGEGKPT